MDTPETASDAKPPTPGDHLVEFYSDCASDYLLTAEAAMTEEQ